MLFATLTNNPFIRRHINCTDCGSLAIDVNSDVLIVNSSLSVGLTSRNGLFEKIQEIVAKHQSRRLALPLLRYGSGSPRTGREGTVQYAMLYPRHVTTKQFRDWAVGSRGCSNGSGVARKPAAARHACLVKRS